MPIATPVAYQTESDCLDALLQCLEDERQALVSSNIEALEQITRRKIEHVQVLEECARERGHSSSHRPEWSALIDRAALCKERNVANASLLQALQRRARWSLDYLGSAPALYGRQGQLHDQWRRRDLGRG